ncbi:MAG TPA: aspartate aminotransferase family protein [Steroidobacteraceae bacterium]|nr:aspartate aminotransferase family protein [Steroidobacteraceae bacterium]
MSRRKEEGVGVLKTLQSQRYLELAKAHIAGGVNSNVRLRAVPPICFAKGEGAHLTDLDGNVYLDYALGMGPNILGHAPATVIEEVARTLTMGQLFAGQHTLELNLAERLSQLIDSAELVRFGLSGSEMVQAAMRVARAHTGRSEIIKFEGHYHGWFDNILVNVGGPVAPEGAPIPRPHQMQSVGQSPHASDDVAVLPWNDFDAIEGYVSANAANIAAIITEPVMFNTGGILPKEGYLQHLRKVATAHGVVLIFDEVITGFRVGLGGAQELYKVTPDLSVFAKALGAGFPVSALVGRRDIMELFASGGVNHSGTYNANVMSISAALAALETLSASGGAAYERMNAQGRALMDGISRAARQRGIDLQVSGFPTVFHTCFAKHPIHDYTSYMRADQQRLSAFLLALLKCRVRPTARGTWFLSTAHTERDIEMTLEAVERALRNLI